MPDDGKEGSAMMMLAALQHASRVVGRAVDALEAKQTALKSRRASDVSSMSIDD